MERARGRTAVFLTIAGGILWVPLIRRMLGRDTGFLGNLGFFDGPQATPAVWLLAALVALAYSIFSLKHVPGVAEPAREVSALKVLAIVAVVPAAVVEEAFFRRIVMHWTQGAGGGALLQIVVSGVAFGCAHGVWAIFTKQPVVGLKAALATRFPIGCGLPSGR